MRTWIGHDNQKRSARRRPLVHRKELFPSPGQQLGSERIRNGRKEVRVSWEANVRSGEGVEVNSGDVIEELALVENPDEVPTDEST